MKRIFDIVVSAAGLIILSPLLLLISVLIKLDSRGPILFKQERIGKGFRAFQILKFRTMIQDPFGRRPLITVGDDPRITRAGRFLRKTKIDELPQLINVLRGDMTFVGPRPEVPEFVELFRQDYEEILTVRPGMTDLASLKYRNEAAVLGHSANPQEEYLRHVLPDKINLNKEYIRRSSFFLDLRLILKTVLKLFEQRV
jgi:lipopolysaccharide/colanic/teichoic acid biosynthesis glycosyltransferase